MPGPHHPTHKSKRLGPPPRLPLFPLAHSTPGGAPGPELQPQRPLLPAVMLLLLLLRPHQPHQQQAVRPWEAALTERQRRPACAHGTCTRRSAAAACAHEGSGAQALTDGLEGAVTDGSARGKMGCDNIRGATAAWLWGQAVQLVAPSVCMHATRSLQRCKGTDVLCSCLPAPAPWPTLTHAHPKCPPAVGGPELVRVQTMMRCMCRRGHLVCGRGWESRRSVGGVWRLGGCTQSSQSPNGADQPPAACATHPPPLPSHHHPQHLLVPMWGPARPGPLQHAARGTRYANLQQAPRSRTDPGGPPVGPSHRRHPEHQQPHHHHRHRQQGVLAAAGCLTACLSSSCAWAGGTQRGGGPAGRAGACRQWRACADGCNASVSFNAQRRAAVAPLVRQGWGGPRPWLWLL